MTTERWPWRVDYTKDIGDEFDEAEVDEKQIEFLQQTGFDWMRQEERIGRWLGFVIAILFWGILGITMMLDRSYLDVP